MPIYYGNTKLDITSKGIVKKLTSLPVVSHGNRYNEAQRFYIRYIPTNQYLGAGSSFSSNARYIKLVDDIADAATFFFNSSYEADDVQLHGDINPDPDSQAVTISYIISDPAMLAFNGSYDSLRIVKDNFDNMLTNGIYMYRDHFVPGTGTIKQNVYNISASSSGIISLSCSSSQDAIALPFELCNVTDIIQTPSGIGKVYYGSTLVYDKDNN